MRGDATANRDRTGAGGAMKIGVVSLGCPKNLVDTEVMLGLLEQAGHEITADAAAADVLVVNTCAFIDAAKQESVDAILDLARYRRNGRCRRLVVTGCLAQRYRDALVAEIPEVDVVLGTGEVPAIVDAVRGDGPERPVVSDPTYLYGADTPRRLATPGHFAYVKVAEGCDYACSFCIIPALRGPYRSRPIDSILREAERLVAGGVREVILVSQDTTFYGIDRGERGALARLLRALDRLDGLHWIRLLYLYPTTLTDDVLAAMAECGKVCRYVDLPLQHVSAPVLHRMRRPGNRRTYEALVRRVRDRVSGVAIRTTFIVGFPGETEEDFAELEAFVADMAFDHVGVFTYSHEEGTAAFALADDVPARVKAARRRRLMARQRRLVAAHHRARLGERVQVLVDGPSPEHRLVLQGRLESQAPEIDPVVYLTDCDATAYAPGSLVEARLVAARGYDLVARPLS